MFSLAAAQARIRLQAASSTASLPTAAGTSATPAPKKERFFTRRKPPVLLSLVFEPKMAILKLLPT
jgi:hypothetical protein